MKIILNKKIIIPLVLIVFAPIFSRAAFAAWDGLPYNPGETSNPECLPSQTDCDVLPAITSELDPTFSTWLSATPPLYSYTETDPIFIASQAYNISSGDITNLSHLSGINTGDETISSIQTKLGIASSSASGYLTSIDWNTFNNKQPAGSYLTSFSELDPAFSTWLSATPPLYSYTETDPIFIASQAYNISSGDITNLSHLSGINTGDDAVNSQYSGLATSKQDILNGTGFVKISGTTISYDNSTYLTAVPAGYLQNNTGITGGTTLIGGTGVTDILKLQGTAGDGTLTSPAIQALVGNNGGTTAYTVLNNGNVGIGTVAPTDYLYIKGLTGGYGGLTIDQPSGAYTTFKASGVTKWNFGNYPTDNSFRLSTGAFITAQLTVLPSGNVGIGTTTPGQKLSVYNGRVNITDTTPYSYSVLEFGNDTTSLLGGFFAGASTATGYGGANSLNLINLSSGPLAFGTDNSVDMVIKTGGNVGIGTTSPINGKLEIYSNTNGAFVGEVIENSNSNSSSQARLSIKSNSGQLTLAQYSSTFAAPFTNKSAFFADTNSNGLNFGALHSNGDVSLFTGGAAASNIRMYVSYTGNIGIGTTSPSYPLHIYSSTTGGGAPAVLMVEAAGGRTLALKGNSPYAEFFPSTGSRLGWFGYGVGAGKFYFANEYSNGPIYFATDGYANIRMTILGTSGNVGIGTTAPTASLFIKGTSTTPLLNITSSSSNPYLFVSNLGNVGIGQESPGYLLHVGSSSVADAAVLLRLQDADSTCDFTANAGAPSCGSDRTLKKNINNQLNNLSKIIALRPVTYNWLTDQDGVNIKHGFVAQEVADVMPELVTDGTWIDGTTKKFLQMEGMTPYLVGAIKEMNLKLPDINNFDKSNDWRDSLVAWFTNAKNHIVRIFTGEICLTDPGEEPVCINRSELKSLKTLLNGSSANTVINSETTTTIYAPLASPITTADSPIAGVEVEGDNLVPPVESSVTTLTEEAPTETVPAVIIPETTLPSQVTNQDSTQP